MKNLKKYLIAGMIGLGSLISGGSWGQVLEEPGVLIGGLSKRGVIAESVNHQEFQIECWRELGDGEIVLNKYFDTNRDGKMDSSSLFVYSTEYNKLYELKAGKDLYFKNALYLNRIKKNLPLGKTFTDCKDGYFKEDIYDYIKSK